MNATGIRQRIEELKQVLLMFTDKDSKKAALKELLSIQQDLRDELEDRR